jgi:phenylalanyl-tRNA synthetase beta chain
MNISLNWIRDFVDLPLVDKKSLKHVVVAYVRELKKHPGADRLNIAQVDTGGEVVQIVCGGVNLVANRYVALALPGAVLPGNFEIHASKIRGEESRGMICAKEELKLGTNKAHEIWLLDEKKKWTAGMPLLEALNLKGFSPEEIAWKTTVHTAEVESVKPEGEFLNHVVSGKLIEFSKIEGSEKLHKGIFDLGWKKAQVIFGSVYQIHIGEILPIALPGAKLPGGDIKVTEMMGVKSEGMVCGDSEIGINNSAEGITRFPKNTPLGVPVADILEMNGYCLEVDNKSLTHRPDLWGHYGFAREFSAIFGKPLKKLDPLLKIKPVAGKEKIDIKIEDNKMCPRFSAAIVTGVKIEESPQWLKARIQAAGMNPHNNIVDITNYVMLELGQPMHAYDRAVVGDDGFTVRYAKKGEKLVTLDLTEQKLHEEDPLVCNKAGAPLGLAGIKGGLKSGISVGTTEIILESAAFDPIVVRKSSLRHVRTDASQRFEKSLDPAMTEVALKRAINLLQQLCPAAKVVSPLTTVGTWKPKKIEITVDPKTINSKIGTTVPTKEMVSILKSLEFGVKTIGKNLKVSVPSHRATRDVNIEEDIVEEVARIHGYDKIPASLPNLPIKLPTENPERFYKHLTRSIFALGLGFTEVVNYSFYSRDRFEKCGIPEQGHVKILNYLSEDQTHMRRTLVPNMLANIASNERNFDQLQIFELGHTYDDDGKYMPREEKHLAAMVAQEGEPFYAIKGALETYLKTFRVSSYQLHPSDYPAPCAHPKKCMDLVVRGKTVGQVFTVHPGVLQAYDLHLNVGAFELRFSPLVENGRADAKFKALPRFPGMAFDVSVLVEKTATVAELEKIVRSADPEKLIETVQLFDIYEGKNIPENQKSLSFAIGLRHPDRTLTEKEFQTVQEAAFLAIEKFGGIVRGRQ